MEREIGSFQKGVARKNSAARESTIATAAPAAEVGQPIVVEHLFGPGADLDALPWQPFRDGVEIVQIYGSPKTGPSAALLRYQPGATMPMHRHTGYEHILVLRASQEDESGTAATGTLVVNPPNSQHTVRSESGCVVLAVWEKPVQFPSP